MRTNKTKTTCEKRDRSNDKGCDDHEEECEHKDKDERGDEHKCVAKEEYNQTKTTNRNRTRNQFRGLGRRLRRTRT